MEIEGPRNPFILFLESSCASSTRDPSVVGFYECWSRDDQPDYQIEPVCSFFKQFTLDLSGNGVSSINFKLLPPTLFLVMTNATLSSKVGQVSVKSSLYDEFNLGYYHLLGRQQVNQKPAQSSQSGLQILITSIFGQEAWIPLASQPLSEEKFLDSLKRLSDFLSRPELDGRFRLEEYPFKSLLLVTSEDSGHTFENAIAYLDVMKSQATDWGIAEEVRVAFATPTNKATETGFLSSPLSNACVISFDF